MKELPTVKGVGRKFSRGVAIERSRPRNNTNQPTSILSVAG